MLYSKVWDGGQNAKDLEGGDNHTSKETWKRVQ